MKIKTIRAYRVLQPFVGGAYNMSKGRNADAFDAVIVSMTSDSGLTGWGEMAPLGNFYSPAFASGARAVKVGGDVRGDIDRVRAVAGAVPKGTVLFCDANAGWTSFQARQFADATRDVDYVFEQPCTTIDECLSVRRMLDKPMVLDESVASLDAMLDIHRKGAADGLTLKISRLGGVTKTRQIRDLAVDLGFMITVEDTGGAEIDTAAMAHLSLSTPEERRLHAIAFHEWVTVRTASNMPPVERNRMGLPDGPGLGIDVREELLGEPFLELEA